MNRRKVKTALLCASAAFLAITSTAVVYADYFLGQVYKEQQRNIRLAAQSTPVPVLRPSASAPVPTPSSASASASTPTPSRAPLPGDIAGVRFPDYDTGVNAEYSYQTNELRIAVDKVEEEGVTYYVADIWMRNINCFRTAFSSGKYHGKRQPAEVIAQENNAILAVNGDFLGGLVIRNGVLYRKATLRPVPTAAPTKTPATGTSVEAPPTETPTPRPATVSRPQRATCVLYYDGTMITEEYRSFRSNDAIEENAWQGWQFGPTLVRNGQAAKDVKAQGRNPRCIIGYYEPGHYALIMIDGRQKGHSIGMNFKEMIDLCLRLGLTEAYNLDGGGSAIMVYGNEIINDPSGTGDARNLPDMVIIGDYLAPDMLFEPTPKPTFIPHPEDSQFE